MEEGTLTLGSVALGSTAYKLCCVGQVRDHVTPLCPHLHCRDDTCLTGLGGCNATCGHCHGCVTCIHFHGVPSTSQSPCSLMMTNSKPCQARASPSLPPLSYPRLCRENQNEAYRWPGEYSGMSRVEFANWWPVDLKWPEDPTCVLIAH